MQFEQFCESIFRSARNSSNRNLCLLLPFCCSFLITFHHRRWMVAVVVNEKKKAHGLEFNFFLMLEVYVEVLLTCFKKLI
jgi:hypothetical protein